MLVSIADDDGEAEIEYTLAAMASSLEEVDVSSEAARWQSARLRGLHPTVSAIYEGMAARLGLRLRGGLTLRQFAIAAESLGEGCALRSGVDGSDMSGILRPTGPQGDLRSWTLLGVGLEALVVQFFELDPDWSPDQGPS